MHPPDPPVITVPALASWGERSIRLTIRQQQVLALMAEGLSTKWMSRRLAIAPATVKVHVGSVLRALNVENRTQAVVVAQRLGLVRIRPMEIPVRRA